MGFFEKESEGEFFKMTYNFYEKHKKDVFLTKRPKTTKFEGLVGADQTKFSPTKRPQKRPNFPETTKSGHTDVWPHK